MTPQPGVHGPLRALFIVFKVFLCNSAYAYFVKSTPPRDFGLSF